MSALRHLDADRLITLAIPPRTKRYADADVMLYALAVGAAARDATADLALVYEVDLEVLPSYAQMLGFDDAWLANGGVDLATVVHGGLDLAFDRTFAPSGEVLVRTRVAGLTDKGPGRGGIIQQETVLEQAGVAVSRSLSSLFVRGGGGFGGDRGVQAEHVALPSTAADSMLDVPTAPNQALLFRLLGDRNPLHADPVAARNAGFAAPILHGAATFGLAALTVVRTFCDGRPHALKRLAARFTGPVYPGETLVFSFWHSDQRVLFRATSKQRQIPVLDGGLAEWHPARS